MASRIISESTKSVMGKQTTQGRRQRQEEGDYRGKMRPFGQPDTEERNTAWGSHIIEDLETNITTTEDKRVSEERALYKDNYEALVANGTLR